MRHARISAALLAAGAILSYEPLGLAAPTPAPATQAHSLALSLPLTFQGVTPCADCPGIQTTVTLGADGTYVLERVYLERQSEFKETGAWSYDARTARLTLRPSGGGSRQLLSVSVSARLQMLDANGDPLPQHVNSTLSEVVPSSTLASTGWALVALSGKPFESSEQRPVTMQFDADGKRVSGSGGCNRYAGSYESSGGRLVFGPLASTQMACPDMDKEQAYFKMLGQVASFKRQGQWLTLFDRSGTPIAKLGLEK